MNRAGYTSNICALMARHRSVGLSCEETVKIRIKDNSIRLRLTRGELQDICDAKIVTSHTNFSGGEQFSYELVSCPDSSALVASFSKNTITIRAPEVMIANWAANEQVSLRAVQTLEDLSELIVLVEKDFACLAPREGEDETEMFPHPNLDRVKC